MDKAVESILNKVFLGIGVFLLVFGTFGNITCIFVLSRSNMSRLKIRLYLIALAVSDLLCLYVPYLSELIRISQGDKHDPLANIKCKFTLIYMLLIDCSSWILVAITVERLLYVVYPFMVHPQKSIAITLISIIGLSVLFNIPIADGWKIKDGECDATILYYIFHFMMCSFIPSIIIIVSTVIIMFTLCRRPKSGSTTSIYNNSILLALATNSIFLCTTLPGTIAWVALKDLFLPMYVLQYVNYAVNFLTYTIAGKMFREELITMICGPSVSCRKSVTNRNSVVETSETICATDTQV